MSLNARRRALVSALAVAFVVGALSPAVATDAKSSFPARADRDQFLDDAAEAHRAAIAQARGCTDECGSFEPTDAHRPSHAPDHVVATLSPGTRMESVARRVGSRALQRIGRDHAALLSVPKGSSISAFLKKLRSDPSVTAAEPDMALRPMSAPQTRAWGVRAIKAPQAHAKGITGDGVVVAVVDTGVDYTHPDLDDNIQPGGHDFIGSTCSSPAEDNDPMDVHGHGTHVAGILAAEDNSFGVLGVAPGAKILPVRVLDDFGCGWDSTVADGIYYAVDNGAQVINVSLGTYWASSVLRQAVEYAADNEVPVVAAAGNFFFYGLPLYPAAFPGVISVSGARDIDTSTDNEPLEKVWWSDWGHADFLAPGVDVLSTTPNDTYSTFSGTSMASPHVAGALALARQALVESGVVSPSAAALQQRLAGSATDAHFNGGDEVSGAGVPNADAATDVVASNNTTVLYREPYLIRGDGFDESTLTVRILDENGAPVADSVSWNTDHGTLSNADASTNPSTGEAHATLTANNFHGSATITATSGNNGTAKMRVIVEDDRVRVDDASISTVTTGDYWIDAEAEPTPPDEAPVSISPQPGDDVLFRSFVGRHDSSFELDRVSIAWSVTDPSNAPVPELSGAIEPQIAFGFGDQRAIESEAMTIPADAPTGAYHLHVVATTLSNGKTHSFDKDFFVGLENADVLIVDRGISLDVEALNFYPFTFGRRVDSPVRRAVEAEGRTFTVWSTPPPPEVMAAHSVVIWLGDFIGRDLDLDAISDYLGRGGNLVVTGEQYASVARFLPDTSARFRDLLNARQILVTFLPDDNHQQMPPNVTFGSTSHAALAPIVGSYELGPYDLNHTGHSTAMFTDEVKLYTTNGAESLATYARGVYSPATAGTVNDDGFSRVVQLGFGLEGINDKGLRTLASVVGALLDFLEPPLDVGGLSKAKVNNSGRDSFVIIGAGFQRVGRTTVALDGLEVQGSVLDRTRILVRIPRRFPRGTYDVTVTNPDGQTETLPNAMKVVRPR